MFHRNTFHKLLDTDWTVCVSEKAIGRRYARYLSIRSIRPLLHSTRLFKGRSCVVAKESLLLDVNGTS